MQQLNWKEEWGEKVLLEDLMVASGILGSGAEARLAITQGLVTVNGAKQLTLYDKVRRPIHPITITVGRSRSFFVVPPKKEKAPLTLRELKRDYPEIYGYTKACLDIGHEAAAIIAIRGAVPLEKYPDIQVAMSLLKEIQDDCT